MSVSLKIDSASINKVKFNLNKLEKDTAQKIYNEMDALMAYGEAEAKRSAPWTDRTSNARNSIFGFAEKSGNTIKGILGIGMDYGVYLELRWNGRYRVIWPTLNILSTKISSFFNKII